MAAALLAEAGVDSARCDAEQLAAHLAGTDRGRLPLFEPPGDEFFGRYRDIVTARARRVPLQHLIGTVSFGPVVLHVGPGVFVPRPETEAILAWATAQSLPARPLIVDACTGSGALAVALAQHRANLGLKARIIGIDDSDCALDYARRNAAGTPVELVRADVTTPCLLPELDGQVDLMVSNPPYIPDAAVLEPEVAQHDPHHALFGGPDGMTVISAVVACWALAASRWPVRRRTRRHHVVVNCRFGQQHKTFRGRTSPERSGRTAEVCDGDEVGAPPACRGERRH